MISERCLTEMFESHLEPTHHAASMARDQLCVFLDEAGIDGTLADDVELAASELMSNAVEQCPTEPIDIELIVDRTALYLTITNHRPAGANIVLSQATMGETLAERGRGLFIVDSLADGMWLHGGQTSTSVSSIYKRRT